MKTKSTLLIVALMSLLSQFGLSQTAKVEPSVQKYLSLKPDLAGAGLKDGYGTIPFTIKNEYSEDVAISVERNHIGGLMTLDDSGRAVGISFYREWILHKGYWGADYSGPGPRRIVLKPGESKTCDALYPMDTLAFVADKKKNVFGMIDGYITRTGEPFKSYSDQFLIPDKLTKPPWVDLGEQSYFSVTPDLTKSDIQYVVEGGSILFPVKITNITSQPYIALDYIRFYIMRNDGEKKLPSPWEVIKTSEPILKPGESITSSGRSYITLSELESQGYKQGDKVVAAVGGRVPNTNQIFECYSAPFELPPLPKGHPPK